MNCPRICARAVGYLVVPALSSVLFGVLFVAGVQGTALSEGNPPEFADHLVLLPGERVLVGVVQEIAGGMVKVNTGELEPRFLPIKGAVEKGIWALKKGDRVEIALSGENLVVDYHPVGHPGWHRVVKGSLAQPLIVGYEWAVIRTDEGKEEAYAVRPLARLKVAAMPLGVPALFLVGEANKILDAAFGSEEELHHHTHEWKRSVPKAADRRVEGIVVKPANWITIRTEDGQERHYEVRPLAQDRLATVPQGGRIILLIDDESKVTDAAFTIGQKK
ncbi:MAG: hypothetical protein KGO52_14395 [Nitrospirota bacterium]|nr:hypothetical protein [Nitrospirota bacterium]